MKTRVILVGIGGASCSGKTTLAKKLCSVIPRCSVIHQDDYWAASESIPVHPVFNIPDVDDAAYTIEWPRFRAAVAQLKTDQLFAEDTADSGSPEFGLSPSHDEPPSFSSLSGGFIGEWRDRFRLVEKEWLARGVKIEWKIIEGFVLFYDAEVVNDLDIQIFLRTPTHVLKQRRLDRSYLTDDGDTWVEPPGYWEQVAYPGYIRAHSHLFHEGDVEVGNLNQRAKTMGLVLLNGEGTEENLSFESTFRETARAVLLKSQPTDSDILTSNAPNSGMKDRSSV